MRFVERPLLLARSRIQCIKLRVSAPEVDHTVSDRGRALDADLIVNVGIFAGLESPFHGPSRGIDVHGRIGNRRRRMNDISGLILPFQSARRGVDRIDIAIAAAEYHHAIIDRRR